MCVATARVVKRDLFSNNINKNVTSKKGISFGTQQTINKSSLTGKIQ